MLWSMYLHQIKYFPTPFAPPSSPYVCNDYILLPDHLFRKALHIKPKLSSQSYISLDDALLHVIFSGIK